jgi:hypothetical protein
MAGVGLLATVGIVSMVVTALAGDRLPSPDSPLRDTRQNQPIVSPPALMPSSRGHAVASPQARSADTHAAEFFALQGAARQSASVSPRSDCILAWYRCRRACVLCRGPRKKQPRDQDQRPTGAGLSHCSRPQGIRRHCFHSELLSKLLMKNETIGLKISE